jgi:hypothetical protein
LSRRKVRAFAALAGYEREREREEAAHPAK